MSKADDDIANEENSRYLAAERAGIELDGEPNGRQASCARCGATTDMALGSDIGLCGYCQQIWDHLD